MDEKRIARFWKLVEKTEWCWLWTGSRNRDGYGNFRMKTGTAKAHRVAWTLTYGPIANDLCVCHKCDTPACVNPTHLFLGTRSENAQDMLRKGRGPCGERSRVNKLTEEDVAAIRRAPPEVKNCDLAPRLGVHAATIGKVRLGQRWRHVR